MSETATVPGTAPPAPEAAPVEPSGPVLTVRIGETLAARLDPNATANAAAAGDEQALASLPESAADYRPPDRGVGEPVQDIAVVKGWQATAFDVGATPSEAGLLWNSTVRHHAQHPQGMKPEVLAISSRTTLATLARLFGEDGVRAIKENADRALAKVHAGNPDLARLLRDAAVSDPLALTKLADVGRRLPALAKRRGR